MKKNNGNNDNGKKNKDENNQDFKKTFCIGKYQIHLFKENLWTCCCVKRNKKRIVRKMKNHV